MAQPGDRSARRWRTVYDYDAPDEPERERADDRLQPVLIVVIAGLFAAELISWRRLFRAWSGQLVRVVPHGPVAATTVGLGVGLFCTLASMLLLGLGLRRRALLSVALPTLTVPAVAAPVLLAGRARLASDHQAVNLAVHRALAGYNGALVTGSVSGALAAVWILFAAYRSPAVRREPRRRRAG